MKSQLLIRKLRIEMRMSQADLAKSLKIHQTSVSSWEIGLKHISFKKAYALIDLCAKHKIKVKLEDLLVA